MKRISPIWRCMAVLAAVLSQIAVGNHAAVATEPCYYSWELIPNPPTGTGRAVAINNQGHVAGNIYRNGTPRAFFWSPDGGLVELPRPQGVTQVVATGLNDHDHIVGYMRGNGNGYGFVWDGEAYTQIPVPDWATQVSANAINNNGLVVGTFSNVVVGPSNAFYWLDGVAINFGETSFPATSIGSCVNEIGEVAGYAGNTILLDSRSYVVKPDSPASWLPHPTTPAGLRSSHIRSLAENGTAAGVANQREPTKYFGVVWTRTETVTIAPPSHFRDVKLESINNSGRAVGYYDRHLAKGIGSPAIAWQAGDVVELTALLVPTPPAQIEIARCINEHGQIVAQCYDHAIVLTPIWRVGDLTGDCVVALEDLLIVLSNFGSSVGSYPAGDVDRDGDVDLSDLTLLLTDWQK